MLDVFVCEQETPNGKLQAQIVVNNAYYDILLPSGNCNCYSRTEIKGAIVIFTLSI